VEPIPVPSHIHYELLLQLLERQTLPSIDLTDKTARENIQTTIIMLRKALVLQKQFEENCEHRGIPTTYRWSLNETGATSSKINGHNHVSANNMSNSDASNNGSVIGITPENTANPGNVTIEASGN
jgi:hypothetical protein